MGLKLAASRQANRIYFISRLGGVNLLRSGCPFIIIDTYLAVQFGGSFLRAARLLVVVGAHAFG